MKTTFEQSLRNYYFPFDKFFVFCERKNKKKKTRCKNIFRGNQKYIHFLETLSRRAVFHVFYAFKSREK